MKAWIIIWQWMGDHAAMEKPLVKIVSARCSPETVRQYVQFYYSSTIYSPDEQMRHSRYNKPEEPPYIAEYERLSGVRYQGRITCGHNPYLEAFIADNIQPSDNEFGITWETTSLDAGRKKLLGMHDKTLK